jgi:hypothetical protein
MEKHPLLTRLLAIAGTVLVCLVLLSPVVFGVFRWLRAGWFTLDYLMPAELSPVALLGGLLLVAASVLARSLRGLIIGGLVAAVLLLVGFQWVAVVSGLASGETEAWVIWWAIVFAGIALFIIALICVAVGGVLLLRRLFSRASAQALPAGAGPGA